MSVVAFQPLPTPPAGAGFFRSEAEVMADPAMLPYQHLVLRAWKELQLTGVLTLHGVPTTYFCDRQRPIEPVAAAELHKAFWNQGVATTLVLREPGKVRVFSSMVAPTRPENADEAEIARRVVETVDLATVTQWADRFYLQLATGRYYSGEHARKFDPAQTVDAYLLDNLTAVRDELVRKGRHGLTAPVAHAFLGRILFACYLVDRGIIQLADYFPGKRWQRLRDVLAGAPDGDAREVLYGKLFPALKRDFNSSMFDDDLAAERETVQPIHIEAVRRFLQGDEIRRGQRALGFWAYDFRFIPVETISAIYENFLDKEGGPEKRQSGAYYTPRFLAEMTLDLALEGVQPLHSRRYLDPACGSGIFLVLLFNRLAAEWHAEHPRAGAVRKAEALRKRLGLLCGVDKNLTACRIACFSLYLALLDQFDPPDLRSYMEATGAKLPNLLKFRDLKRKAPDLAVVWERDFLGIAADWRGAFQTVVGNPPWAGRGKKQIAQNFMDTVPDVLVEDGRSCLLLPSKVFLNQTDVFQAKWFRRVSVNKMVQLADYSFLLFKEALCPCTVVRFEKRRPNLETHEIEYVAPKVSRVDLRDGVIPVAPQDRKWVSLQRVLDAAEQRACPMLWKSLLWGTPRDHKLLNALFELPRLSDITGTVRDAKLGRKQWWKGQGFQPLKPGQKIPNPKVIRWKLMDPFVTAASIEGVFCVPEQATHRLGAYLSSKGYRTDKARRIPNDKIFQPPLVLINQGFSEAAFFDYTVRFQHSLQSIAGPPDDADKLLFLTAYMRSKLARYFIFHTVSNLGTERDKAHLFEVLRLPFFLPGDEAAPPAAESLIARTAKKIRRIRDEMHADWEKVHKSQKNGGTFRLESADEGTAEDQEKRWIETQRKKARKLQDELDGLIFDYFGLDDQERALVDDTKAIFDRSDTPPSLAAATNIPTLKEIEAEELQPYADMLTGTLNEWATGSLRVSAEGGVDAKVGLAVVELRQTRTSQPFQEKSITKELAVALERLQKSAIEDRGSLAYLRGSWIFDSNRIYLVKPAQLGAWTRTAALNDAGELYAYIADARQLTRSR